ncbi:MAG: DUF4105 domain-containing protein [Mangrovibacterium sp.]
MLLLYELETTSMKNCLLLLVLLFSTALPSQARINSLSDEAEISLITCDVHTEVYAMYGHSAIRVRDVSKNMDIVFNYGLFSFSEPHFIYRFAKGKTDYLLGAQNYAAFLRSYQHSKRSLSEQKLNLTSFEKESLFSFLIWNVQPQNATYRYNFFYDNCATRIRDAVEKCIDGEIIYGKRIGDLKTFRQLVDHYQEVAPWTNFGIHLLLGSPADIEADTHEQMFLPPYLEAQYAQTKVKRNDKVSDLCQPARVIYQAPEPESQCKVWLYSPSLVMALLLLCYILLTCKQWKSGNIKYHFDYVWLILNGIIGIILTWFFFFSELPAMKDNYNLLWAFAFNLPFAFAWMKESWRSKMQFYWFIPSIMSVGFLLSAAFLPQSFPLPIYLFVMCSAVRSLFILYKIRN